MRGLSKTQDWGWGTDLLKCLIVDVLPCWPRAGRRHQHGLEVSQELESLGLLDELGRFRQPRHCQSALTSQELLQGRPQGSERPERSQRSVALTGRLLEVGEGVRQGQGGDVIRNFVWGRGGGVGQTRGGGRGSQGEGEVQRQPRALPALPGQSLQRGETEGGRVGVEGGFTVLLLLNLTAPWRSLPAHRWPGSGPGGPSFLSHTWNIIIIIIIITIMNWSVIIFWYDPGTRLQPILFRRLSMSNCNFLNIKDQAVNYVWNLRKFPPNNLYSSQSEYNCHHNNNSHPRGVPYSLSLSLN